MKIILGTMVSVLVTFFTGTPVYAKNALQASGYFKAAEGIQLYYQFTGSGKDTIVMIHGGPGMDAGYMIADFDVLAKDHVLLFYDQRGGGRSSLPDTNNLAFTLHIDRHIEDLEALRKYFSFNTMTLLGHSFGTVIAGKYAIAYPDHVKKMILIGAVPPYAGDFNSRYDSSLTGRLTKQERDEMDSLSNEMSLGKNPRAACKRYWQIAMKPRIAAGLSVDIIRGDCCTAPEAGIRYGYRYTGSVTNSSLGNWDFRNGLKNIPAPVLLIHGDEESIPMDMVEEWTKYLPHSRLEKISRAAHFPYVERPEIVWPLIENFLVHAP